MMRYRLFWFEDMSFFTVDIEAVSESAARQAWIDGDLPQARQLGSGHSLTEHGNEVRARLFTVIELTDQPNPYIQPPAVGGRVMAHCDVDPGEHEQYRPSVRDLVSRLMLADDLDAPVVMQDHLGWYAHVGHVAYPEDDDGHDYVTIYLGDQLAH